MILKLVITGASGVLGHALVVALLAKGYEVVAITSHPDILRQKFDITLPLVCCGWSDFLSERIDLKDIDVVIHCAFARNQNCRELARSMELSEKLFRWVISNDVPAIINISSQSIYGEMRKTPSKETDEVDPQDAYALVKLACERLGAIITEGTSSKFTSIRLASLIGPQFEERFVNKMLRDAVQTGEISVIGGQQVFSFMDIRDAVSGILMMLNVDYLHWKPIYNLGSEESYSIVEIAYLIANFLLLKTGKRINVLITPQNIYIKRSLNCALFKRDFNFTSKISLYESLYNIYKEKILYNC